jgi:hypothetical protein
MVGGEWEPAPDGPPPRSAGYQVRGKFDAVKRWCKDNPGVWATVRDCNGSTSGRFGRWGYEVEARQRFNLEGELIRGRYDLWIRWPK